MEHTSPTDDRSFPRIDDTWPIMAVVWGRSRVDALRAGGHPDEKLETAVRYLERFYTEAGLSQTKSTNFPPDLAHFMEYLKRSLCPRHLVLTLKWQDGADLSDVGDNFIIRLLSHSPQPIWPRKHADYEVLENIADLYRRRAFHGDEPSDDEWTSASMHARIICTSAVPAEAATVRNLDARLSHLTCLALKEAVNMTPAWKFIIDTLARLLEHAPVPESK